MAKLTTMEEYFIMQEDCIKKHGDRTVLFMDIGSFSNCFEFNPTNTATDAEKTDSRGRIWSKRIGFAEQVSQILDFDFTSSDGSRPHTLQNPNLCGFPTVAFEKSKNILLSKDFIVARAEQVKTKVGNKVVVSRPSYKLYRREVSIDPDAPTNNIVCIYLEYQSCVKPDRFDTYNLTTGVAVIDIATGDNSLFEFHSQHSDEISPLLELYRFLTIVRPMNCVVYINDIPTEFAEKYSHYIIEKLELNRFAISNTSNPIKINELPNDFKNAVFQKESLCKLFITSSEVVKNTKIFDILGISGQNYGRIAYIALINYCHQYDPMYVNKLKKPKIDWLDANKYLILSHNCIQQLNIANMVTGSRDAFVPSISKDINSLFSVVNKTCTLMGRRLLIQRLLSPMILRSDIETHYNMVDEMSTSIDGQPLWHYISTQLKLLPDIDKLQRKLDQQVINPKELSKLYKAYLRIVTLYVEIVKLNVPVLHTELLSQEDSLSINEWLNKYSQLIDFDALGKCKIEDYGTKQYMIFKNSFVYSGYYSDLDSQLEVLDTNNAAFDKIVSHLDHLLRNTRGRRLIVEGKKTKPKKSKKVSEEDEDGGPASTLIATSAAKAKVLSDSCVDVELCGKLNILPYVEGNKLITSDRITRICNNIDSVKIWLYTKFLDIYRAIIKDMAENYTFYSSMIRFLAKIDLIHSYAKCAYKFKYVRPALVENTNGASFDIKGIRHPIVERIISCPYVTNDIALGNFGDHNGLLLYGSNTAGKTTFVKAAVCCVVMAQAGMFVPASSMTLVPYNTIITRLTASDDMFSGKSSFFIEMSELRTAIRRSDENTLVVGDELSRGTQNSTAAAIAGASIDWLSEAKSTFLFSSHIRETLSIKEIKENKRLKVSHLTLEYDGDSFSYGRKLKDGICAPGYGIAVARSIGLPDEFIQKVTQMANQLEDNNPLVKNKRSKYNKQVILDRCVLCNSSENLQTHHIEEQQHSVDGFVGHIPIHSEANLVGLCCECHTLIHSKGLKVSLIETDNGIKVKLISETTSAM